MYFTVKSASMESILYNYPYLIKVFEESKNEISDPNVIRNLLGALQI